MKGKFAHFAHDPRLSSENESIVFMSARGEFVPKSSNTEDEIFTDENMGSEEISLEEYVLRQIISDLKEDERLMLHISLISWMKMVFLLKISGDVASYYHVPVRTIEEIKK